jgi:hypothetical protein
MAEMSAEDWVRFGELLDSTREPVREGHWQFHWWNQWEALFDGHRGYGATVLEAALEAHAAAG